MNFQLQKSVSIIHSNCRHLFRKIALLQRFYRSEDYCRYLSLTCIRNILVEAKRVNLWKLEKQIPNRTKYFVGQNFRHQAEISTNLSNFCLTFVLKYWTKFSTDKIFRRTKFPTPSRNFDSFVRFLPDFCIEILDKIFAGQNVSSDKIFDTKLKFRHFCPTTR